MTHASPADVDPAADDPASRAVSDDGLPRDPGDDTPDPAHAVTAPAVPVPVWLELFLLLALLGVICCGGFGLALAVVGHYSFGLSVGVGAPVAVLLTALGARPLVGHPDVRPDRRGGTLPAVVAVLFLAVHVAFNALRSGDWITIDRDPGVYAVTAKWLTEHASLVIPYRPEWNGSGLPLFGSTLGVYESGGKLEFQFDHLLPVVLAQAGRIAGDRGLLAGNAVLVGLGLLAVYVVGVRLVGRPWIVLAAVVGLGLALPVLYVARAPWSEGLTMLLVWGGTWLLISAWDRRSIVLALLGGLVVGGSVMARIDALVYLVPLPLLAAAVALVLARDERWRRVALMTLAALVGAAVPVTVGTVDVVYRAGFYYRDLADQIGLLQKVAVLSLGLGVVAVVAARVLRPVVRGLAPRVEPHVPRIAAVLGVFTVLLVIFAWALRPALDRTTGAGIPLIGGLQAREGAAVDATRLYSEEGVVWLSWYLGVPAVALGALGLGVLVRRAVRGVPAALIVLGTTGAGVLFYLYRLSNTPDQLFGVRRYVPAVLPLFALAAAVAVAALAGVLPGLLGEARQRWARPVVGLALVALIVFPLGTSSPLREMSIHRGLLGAVDEVCTTLGPDAAIVFPGPGYGQIVAPQTLRSFCDVPVTATTRAITPAELATAAAFWTARGRTLWVVDVESAPVAGLVGAGRVDTLGTVSTPYDPTLTLTRAPDAYTPYVLTFYGARAVAGG